MRHVVGDGKSGGVGGYDWPLKKGKPRVAERLAAGSKCRWELEIGQRPMRATNLRPGLGVKFDGKIYVITQFEHRTPGNLRAFIQLKIKDAIAGKTIEKRIHSADDVEVITLDRRPMEYLYSDISGATFMDKENYDQVILPKDVLGDALMFLRPNAEATVLFYDGNA